ncbi:terminase large subunit [Pseudoalteromonas shioyasakiensis]|uniref:terminase large subunit n=1 Tax=Pseudoalteromonas shioyasakiensis TaxID=1190813 RepID=UPI0022B16716|nr:terminase TerL endonuclease subunit [Pseudoalteromonas shioyasakiensis]MCZ4253489.1 terminase large subunit [Pseudoalteromonas shioyasakiensis]
MATFPNVNAANKYARDVVAGKIPNCREVILACQRHLGELAKEKDPSFQFRFDKAKAERICSFIQKMPHTKGEWARKKLKISLEPWQLFFFAASFGWVVKKTGKRRFREVMLKVPRKNGKSIIAAGVGIYGLCADEEFGSEVYCGATNENQAWEVFKPAKLMAQKLPKLCTRFGLQIHAKQLTRNDGSVFKPVIGQPGDGSSPHIAIVDEYHEHNTSEQYDTFDTGMGSREQPMTLVITTAGTNLMSPCFDLELRVKAMLNGTQDDHLFGLLYGIDEDDDWTDPAILKKANPNYGISVKADYLLAQQQKAINSPNFTNTFKTKHLNMWASAKSAYFNMEKYKECEDKDLSIDFFRGVDCVQALDLARKLDMNSKVRLFWKEIEGKTHWYCVAPQFWVPYEQVFNNENKQLEEIFQRYLTQGYLSVTDGAEIDYRQIKDDVIASHLETPCISVPIDPHGATNLSHHLADEGLEVVTVTQNFTNLSDPMKELEAAINSGRFHHDGNPIMAWHISNVIGKHYQGNDDVVRPVKQKAINKIDGAVALIMAIGEAMLKMREPPSIKSIYDSGEVGC